MLYTLLLYGSESAEQALPADALQRLMEAFSRYNEALLAAGILRGGAQLAPTAAATTLRLSSGHRHTRPGPAADTDPSLGGFYLIEVATLEEALGWAERCPGAAWGSIEVRPVAFSPV